MKSAKLEREEAARRRWRLAGEQFSGLSPRLRAKLDLQNIRRAGPGYQVVITRCRSTFSYFVPGLDEESLKAAMVLRDKLVREAPPRRKNAIPAEVLGELGLSEPVIGIYRLESRSCYRVYWTEASGRSQIRAFYFRRVAEKDAYAAAISFREELDRVKWLHHSKAGKVMPGVERGDPVSFIGSRRMKLLPAGTLLRDDLA